MPLFILSLFGFSTKEITDYIIPQCYRFRLTRPRIVFEFLEKKFFRPKSDGESEFSVKNGKYHYHP